jgi:mRNA interferase YafQ
MPYSVDYSTQFKRSLKLCRKRGLDIDILRTAVSILVEKGCLPASYRPHILHGKYEGIWECHLKGDWLLLWTQNDHELTLLFLDTGSHSDLFDHS